MKPIVSLTAPLAEGREFPIHREPDTGAWPMPLTFSPRANTASPAALMLVAALMSRSWYMPHSGQSHCLIDNGSDDKVYPQPEHRFELGNHWSMAISERPAQSALYANWRTNSPQPASAIALLSEGLRIMFFPFRDSTQINWFSLINLRDSLCKLSCRQSAIGDLGVQFCHLLTGLGTISRTELFLAQSALRLGQSGSVFRGMAGITDPFTLVGDKQVFQTQISAGHIRCDRQLTGFKLAQAARKVAASRVFGNSQGAGFIGSRLQRISNGVLLLARYSLPSRY